jgi:hypothetical protein
VRYEIVRDEASYSKEGDEEGQAEEKEVSKGISKGQKEIYIFFLT